MSNSIDLRIIGIGLVALVLAFQDQSKTNWANLTEALAQANLRTAPCTLPLQDHGPAQKPVDYTGSIDLPMYRLCR